MKYDSNTIGPDEARRLADMGQLEVDPGDLHILIDELDMEHEDGYDAGYLDGYIDAED